MRVGLYAGSFDPMTLGHLDIITRAARILDQVIVGVGQHSSKAPLFSLTERLEMIRTAAAHIPNLRAVSFMDLAVECAQREGALVLIRGLRSEADFSYEMQMAMMNRLLAQGLETVFIPANQQFIHVSSTLVREVASYGKDVSRLVPPIVSQKLSEKFTST